jgi:hypothetical protein
VFTSIFSVFHTIVAIFWTRRIVFKPFKYFRRMFVCWLWYNRNREAGGPRGAWLSGSKIILFISLFSKPRRPVLAGFLSIGAMGVPHF